jgi:putative NIF3 family GTP cyclohydrolase 1 type 2
LHLGPDEEQMIETIGWCTGGAQGYLQYAIDAGVDAYLTGEVSEPSHHLAVETGTHFFAAGHHATERYGARALGQHLADKFDVEVTFIDIDNPV